MFSEQTRILAYQDKDRKELCRRIFSLADEDVKSKQKEQPIITVTVSKLCQHVTSSLAYREFVVDEEEGIVFVEIPLAVNFLSLSVMFIAM